MDLRIKEIEPINVAYVRHIGPYEECAPAWDKIFEWAKSKGIYPNSALWIGVLYDNPETTPANQIRYDICIALAGPMEGDDIVQVQTLPGGKYAAANHLGAYSKIGTTFKRIFSEGLPINGLTPRMGPCYEFYTGDCEGVPEEQLVTQLYVPVV